ncbi:DUF2690 domain-containing protein [Streptomyces coeruleoprunus]|uniref:DUF2690 domain-containing protein n=1 Tax=Streptomyces coeruleoprunus TaxID=285563 RepID=A0ABV9XBS6_9ACTN
MGVEGHEPAQAAKQRLARLLRSWWEEDPGKVTQEALARRITERGVRTSQEMLSRYLHRSRPTLARPDVIRAMHEVLGRKAEELAAALELHAAATAASAATAAPAAPAATVVTAAQGPEGAAAPEPAAASAHVPTVASAPAPAPAPEPVLHTVLRPHPAPPAEAPAAPSRPKWPWIAVAAAAVVGASGLTAAVTLAGDDRSARGQSPSRSASPTPSAPPAGPTPSTAECRGESCFGIDPKYAVCRQDAATYYTGRDHGILVELRFSPTCQAAWAKMSGTSQGDVVRVTNNAGRSRHYTQQWGHDAHSTMVEALNPDDAKACARTPRGEVCATVPAAPSTAPSRR